MFVCTSCTVWHCRKQVWILTRHQNLKKKKSYPYTEHCARAKHTTCADPHERQKDETDNNVVWFNTPEACTVLQLPSSMSWAEESGHLSIPKNGHLLEDGGVWVTCRASCHKSNHVNDSKITKISHLNGGMRPLKSRCSFFSCFSFC